MELGKHAAAHLGGFAADLSDGQPRHVVGRHANQPVGFIARLPVGADQPAAQPQPLQQLGRQHGREDETIPAAAFITFARAGQGQIAQRLRVGLIVGELHAVVAGQAREDLRHRRPAAHCLDHGGVDGVQPLVL